MPDSLMGDSGSGAIEPRESSIPGVPERNRLVAEWTGDDLTVTFTDAIGGRCPYAEMEWCCNKQAGHDGPHESASFGGSGA